MLFDDKLDALRERNKELLNQLWLQREKRDFLNGCSQSRKRERKAEAKKSRQSAGVLPLTLTDGDRGPFTAYPDKPTVRFADTYERQTNIQKSISTPLLTSKYSGGNAQHTETSNIFKDSSGHPEVQERQADTTPPIIKSCRINHCKEQTEAGSRVTFQSDECEEIPSSDKHYLQPLLGYDWIAGILDAEDSLIERSDEFFHDLCMFRSLNKDECVHNPQVEVYEQNQSVLDLLTDKNDSESRIDTHQCTFSYRINNRLFPVPLHSQECCPVCNKDKSTYCHTTAEPTVTRVSIPLSILLPSYKYKAHRRCSFDPSDSLGLPSHCLSGWLNTGQSTLSPSCSLDLRSSLNIKSSTGLQKKEVENLLVPTMSCNQISDQISDVSRLARHNFRHTSPKIKLGGITSYHVS